MNSPSQSVPGKCDRWERGKGKGERGKEGEGNGDKDLHPMICSEDGNEHGNMYDQRTSFGSDDIDYPAKPVLDCVF